MRTTLFHVMICVVSIGCMSIRGMYQNALPLDHQCEEIAHAIDEIIKQDADYIVTAFLQLRRNAVMTRCIQRLPLLSLTDPVYCDQEGTLYDHVKKEALILQRDIASGDPCRIEDIVGSDDGVEFKKRYAAQDRASLQWEFTDEP